MVQTFACKFCDTKWPKEDVPTTRTIWNRLQTFNCELFQRSKVAMPELASSVQNNIESLLGKNFKLVNNKTTGLGESHAVLCREACILCRRCSAIFHSVLKYTFTNAANRVPRRLWFLLHDCYMMFSV